MNTAKQYNKHTKQLQVFVRTGSSSGPSSAIPAHARLFRSFSDRHKLSESISLSCRTHALVPRIGSDTRWINQLDSTNFSLC